MVRSNLVHGSKCVRDTGRDRDVVAMSLEPLTLVV